MPRHLYAQNANLSPLDLLYNLLFHAALDIPESRAFLHSSNFPDALRSQRLACMFQCRGLLPLLSCFSPPNLARGIAIECKALGKV